MNSRASAVAGCGSSGRMMIDLSRGSPGLGKILVKKVKNVHFKQENEVVFYLELSANDEKLIMRRPDLVCASSGLFRNQMNRLQAQTL